MDDDKKHASYGNQDPLGAQCTLCVDVRDSLIDVELTDEANKMVLCKDGEVYDGGLPLGTKGTVGTSHEPTREMGEGIHQNSTVSSPSNFANANPPTRDGSEVGNFELSYNRRLTTTC